MILISRCELVDLTASEYSKVYLPHEMFIISKQRGDIECIPCNGLNY